MVITVRGWGSGAYIRLGDRYFVLTNEHVASVRKADQYLGHQFLGDEELYRIIGNHVDFPLPLDLALLPVSTEAWAKKSNGSRAIEIEQIAIVHDPVPGELLTFIGFSGQATSFHFDTLCTEGTCSTGREVDLPADDRFDSRFHFGIDYRPDRATKADGNHGLMLP